VEFDLVVRGDAERLRRTLDTSTLLVATSRPQDTSQNPAVAASRPELVYAFRTVR
jgi:hypothetical protein